MAVTIRSAGEPNAVLDQLSAGLQVPLSAERVAWREAGEQMSEDAIPIPTTETPRYELVVGRMAGGRRLLSGDIEMLHAVAGLAARRIDAMRLEEERGQQRQREHDINRLATEAELRALRAQVNPHFLFNALNTVGYLIEASPERAQRTLMKLSAILRGVLRTSGSSVPLGEELDLVHAYLDIERARFEERLDVEIEVDDDLRAIHVPPFLIQPLVENAIKHGIAPSRDGGRIAVSALVREDALVISVRNTGSSTNEVAMAIGRREGVGLANLEARLRQHYGPLAKISVTSTPVDTVARLTLPLSERDLVDGRRA
jgi:two-component system LytT family sensor kinase